MRWNETPELQKKTDILFPNTKVSAERPIFTKKMGNESTGK